MPKIEYPPVSRDHDAFLKKHSGTRGFAEVYEHLEDEYMLPAGLGTRLGNGTSWRLALSSFNAWALVSERKEAERARRTRPTRVRGIPAPPGRREEGQGADSAS